MTYSEKIKEIRESQKLSQRELAEKIGINHATISLLEKGYRKKGKVPIIPLIDTLKQICDGLNYPFRKFLEETGYIVPLNEKPPVQTEDLKEMINEFISDEELEKIPEGQKRLAVAAFSERLKDLDKTGD